LLHVTQNELFLIGTENVQVANLQAICAEYYWGEPINKAVLKGQSKLNQRIESWWCIYRKEVSEYYISLFYQLEAEGAFSGDEFDKELVRFCFLGIIQVLLIHNQHFLTMLQIKYPFL